MTSSAGSEGGGPGIHGIRRLPALTTPGRKRNPPRKKDPQPRDEKDDDAAPPQHEGRIDIQA